MKLSCCWTNTASSQWACGFLTTCSMRFTLKRGCEVVTNRSSSVSADSAPECPRPATDLCSASQNTVLTDFPSFSLYRWRLFPPSGCTDPKSSWHLFHTVIAPRKQDQPCLSNIVCIVCARAAVWGFNDPQWIVFPNDGLTICEVPGEGDGPFAAEHPPDLTHRQRAREARKWNIYQRQNTFMIALNIYLTIKENNLLCLCCCVLGGFASLGKSKKQIAAD